MCLWKWKELDKTHWTDEKADNNLGKEESRYHRENLCSQILLLSQLVYVIQAICLPENALKEINSLLYRFLWRKKDCNRRAFEKVKRVIINSEIEKGGLKMIDIRTMQESFLCERITKLISEKSDQKWTWIPKIHFRYFGKEYACLSSTVGHRKFKGINHVKSIYWKTAVINWLTLNNKAPFFQTEKICI